MSSSLFLILVLIAIVFLWLDGARARELATGVIDELCKRRGYQLLDGTVSLARMGLAHTQGGLRLRRLFRFDYSVEGVGRLQGEILLHGTRVVLADLQEPESEQEKEVGPSVGEGPIKDADDSKVVPFRRRH